ncbi:hypothetical protein HMPREF3223_00358 [Cutibacterium avidum]|nr:hypothetical protein HMPREF3223_00358 [Cutibacterium avidum]
MSTPWNIHHHKHDSLIPKLFATWVSGSPWATRSKTRCRYSDGFATGITDSFPEAITTSESVSGRTGQAPAARWRS